MDSNREDLVQTLVDYMIATTKHAGHVPHMHRPDLLPIPKFELSPPQARILFTIAGAKQNGISVKELAEFVGVTSGAVTQFVDSLVEKKLVRRLEDVDDRRIVRLKLTDEVREHFEKIRKHYLSSMIQRFDVLSDDEIRQMITLLSKVKKTCAVKETKIEQ